MYLSVWIRLLFRERLVYLKYLGFSMFLGLLRVPKVADVPGDLVISRVYRYLNRLFFRLNLAF